MSPAATPWSGRLQGPEGRLFADPAPSPDETAFQVDNTSAAYYESPYYAQHAKEVLPVPLGPPAAALELESVAGPLLAQEARDAGRIVFHAVGDTGASESARIASEALVADAMAADIDAEEGAAPAFLFHLGDLIYEFGEAVYYYDQFYEPFREYDRPIFAIPGNHDGAVTFTEGGDKPDTPSLQAFIANFCADSPGHPADGGGLARTTMTQPGVYFTLEAPFVAIVGLYTNVLEGPGVISDHDGRYPGLKGDRQVEWLTGELARLAPRRAAGECAVIVACHHPPASADWVHGGSTGLSRDLDGAFERADLWPDAVLSGHAHVYQRFSRATAGRQIPYVVAGSGGHGATVPRGERRGEAPRSWNEFTLEAGPTTEYGYLTVTVDMHDPQARTLTISFSAPGHPDAADAVTVPIT